MKNYLLLFLLAFVIGSSLAAQNPWYVDPVNGDDDTADGSIALPFKSIPVAIDSAHAGGGGEVWVKSGVYELTSSQKITTAATAADSVIVRPEAGGAVTFNFGVRSAFDFQVGSSYITFQDFEVNGQVGEENDFWCVVAEDFWSEFGNPQGGGLAIIADGEHLNIYRNYLHDCYQKGVEIADGRYINVRGNIISNIAQYSLSGGHGIMRQQAGDLEYDDPDEPGLYRWDLYGNMIFNVEQRIYSWVPRKGFIEMVIDEGKSILIDDPKQTNAILDVMTARIAHNVVAFGAVDHIRLKSTPGLEVSNNSIYSEGENADGITVRVSDTNENGPNTLFTNFQAHGNVAQTNAAVFAVEMDHAIGESYGSGNDPMGNTPANTITNNYAAVGKFKPRNEANVGIFNANTTQLFVDPNAGDFTINPSAGLPSGVGVDPAILAELNSRADDFGVTIGWDGWLTDNLLLSQTILDNVPGVNDGIPGNETVFTDAGTFVEQQSSNDDHTHILYNVVDGSWKAERRSPSTQQFFLNEEYLDWYEEIKQTYLNSDQEEYPRIRYGSSYIKQDKVFPATWLTVCEINAEGNTFAEGYDNTFTLGGDLLINISDVTPLPGDSYDLMAAGSIVGPTAARLGQNSDLFNRVLFPDGAEPDDWSLEVVTSGDQEVLRFNILNALPVELLAFSGTTLAKANRLDWTTAQEDGFDRFVVERSTDAQTWERLGAVAGAGAVGGAGYDYIDATPPAVAFYRLRIIDLDGTEVLSDVVLLERATTNRLNVYPNPSGGTFQIALGESGPGDLAIYTLHGTRVRAQKIAPDATTVMLDDLPPGVYLAVVTTEGGQRTAKVRVR